MEYSRLITTGFKNTYFKIVFTSNSHQYLINPQWTVTQFIEIMRPVVCRDFNLENCEFVDTIQQHIPLERAVAEGAGERGNSVDVSRRISENGAALIYQNNVTLASKYGDDLNVAFYIRPISIQLIEIPENDTQLRCVICMTRQRNMLFNPCRHICCCSECAYNNIHECPICRQVISEQFAIYLY